MSMLQSMLIIVVNQVKNTLDMLEDNTKQCDTKWIINLRGGGDSFLWKCVECEIDGE